ncbi:MAG: M1 family aminopeptidase [Chitinophagaceae bacterium]
MLHMLRKYVGDSAFFKSLNKYLTDYKFKNAEAHQLRFAFEEVTGQDLNWFWNQWYFGSGHPQLKINYSYTNGKVDVITEQTQNTGKIFRLPVAIDVYNGVNKSRYNVWIENKTDTFVFNTAAKPTLINVDADKILLVDKTDKKSPENWIEQWKYAGNYLDRKEALNAFSKNKMKQLGEGLEDKFEGLRLYTLESFQEKRIDNRRTH